jgi:phosphoglycolate phosphatase
VIPRFQTYIFDVDGTLLDSAADICGAIREVLHGTRHQHCEELLLRVYIGRHLSDLFQVLFPEFTPEQVEELRLRYRAHYLARNHGGTTLYPGVMEALEALDGAKATATTKSTPTTRDVLRRFGLLPHFQHVQGTDGFPAKPEPDVVLRAMEALDARPENCLMVGDAPADICAGRRAGVKTCAVRYGYGMETELAAQHPDYWIDDLRQLL